MKPITSRAGLARLIDHAIVHPWATREEVTQHCCQAREQGFHGVSVNGSRVQLAYSILEDTDIKIIGLVGFPLGACASDVKRYETEAAIDEGANEIEFVVNIGRLKDGDHQYVLREMRDLAEAAEERSVTVIIETGLLQPPEIAAACELALDSGLNFVCNGSGLGAPADAGLVKNLKELVGEKFGVKAAGGVRNAQTALVLFEAGASRIGTVDGMAVLNTFGK